MEDPKWLEPALGYLELKMFDEAWAELGKLAARQSNTLVAAQARITCRLDEGRLEDALELCGAACERFPDEHLGFIQGAYCLHAMERSLDAKSWLQSGPVSLQVEAKYFYNLGCYDLALGNEDSACAWLIQAFEMEPSFHADALKDPDFHGILRRIEEMKEEDDELFI